MKLRHNLPLFAILVALSAVLYAIYRTGDGSAPAATRSARRAQPNRSLVVDQGSLLTAEELVRLPTSADEQRLAEDALRIADNEMDLAFAQAVRVTASQPRANTPEAREADVRLQRSLRALTASQARVAELTAALAKATPAQAESLDDRLNLAKADEALDQDEVDDARQDLQRAGGDPQGRMQEMVAQHEAASKGADSVHVVVAGPTSGRGLLRRLQSLRALYAKDDLVAVAKAQADSLADAFKKEHDRLESHGDDDLHGAGATAMSHDASAALLEAARRRVLDGKLRTTLDQRHDNQRELSSTYVAWAAVLATQERVVTNRALRDLALILGIVLVALLLVRWIEHLVGRQHIDGRRTHTLYLVIRVAVQVVAVLVILLVVFGPPDNLSTLIGLAGAGLTVALKDFIVGFLGWFVLMGKTGIRIGDVVEINGVTGEVVELGMFYTELLETGHWTEAGYPTGRRVTFSNSFAIGGHYFNFSTSGRWLWDDVRVVVPVDHDPYPIAEALQKQAEAATSASAQEAEAQWKEARRLPKSVVPTAGASASFKPIMGGVEITVRFITRVTEREELRKALIHTALEMLGGASREGNAPVAE